MTKLCNEKKYIFLILFTLIITQVSHSQDNFQITHGPYLCDMGETGVTIVWTTNNNSLAWVEIAPEDGSNFYSCERPKYFETKNGRILATSTLHRVRISNLKSGTKYRYAIFSKEVLSSESKTRVLYGTIAAKYTFNKNSLSFKTFSHEDDSVNFLVFNDLHGRSQFMRDVCKNLDFKDIDLVFFNGDMSTAINSEEQIFTDFIDASVELFATRIPIAFTRGNHETRGTFADYLMDYFPKESKTIYELLHVGHVAFLMLDCGEDKPDSDIEYSGLADFDSYRIAEANWLKETVQLSSFKSASVKIAILHMPPTVSNWHGNLHLTETLLPVLNDATITAMFSGHTHRYSFNPAVPGKINFPVLVNSNNAVVRCDIVKGKVKSTVVGLEGKPLEIQLN